MLLHYLAKFEHSDNRQTLLQISRAHIDTDGTSYNGRSKSLAVRPNRQNIITYRRCNYSLHPLGSMWLIGRWCRCMRKRHHTRSWDDRKDTRTCHHST